VRALDKGALNHVDEMVYHHGNVASTKHIMSSVLGT
jgi:hypothetical protein